MLQIWAPWDSVMWLALYECRGEQICLWHIWYVCYVFQPCGITDADILGTKCWCSWACFCDFQISVFNKQDKNPSEYSCWAYSLYSIPIDRASDASLVRDPLFNSLVRFPFNWDEALEKPRLIGFLPGLLQLERPVRAEGNVEVWLMSLMNMAQWSLHGVIRAAAMTIQDSAFNLLEFCDSFPAQVQLNYYLFALQSNIVRSHNN